ncbi:hypothetical protein [Thermodesulforhabdus norvegica]|uniref:Chordopoxvirus fusion protein n=1 Tax=Thermodesulforhabdus norvegica TaxID=39841 RepID=A0A1I4QWR3_9BACT|nr:hypothetical protein [Thermodesulforhabdus norvegica]SFM44245.1 hypothetical protein SAMN05660836_00253 [Thermodesulforhabdus norvegica]
MPVSAAFIRKLDRVPPELRDVLIGVIEEIERQREESVTKSEFNELKEIVKQLAEAQRKTEERINELAEAQRVTEERVGRLEAAVEKLVEAQRDTEERVKELAEAQRRTEERVRELAEAQRVTEERVGRLEATVEKLVEAQRDIEKKVKELAEAQKKTEQRLNELAEAQKKTEETLRKLIRDHSTTREQLGGLAHTVGYILEDRAYASLPGLLVQEGVHVDEIKRDFVEVSPGRYEEINILGRGTKDGKPIWILGECKTQLKKKDVDSFLKKIPRLEHLFPGEKILVAATYQTSPQVREYLKHKGIKLYFSYQFRL